LSRFAPEVTLRHFQARNGQGYLDLLRSLLPVSTPNNQYVRIQHPAVDAQFGIRGPLDTSDAVSLDPAVFGQRMYCSILFFLLANRSPLGMVRMDMYRSRFINLVVWHILLSFHNMSEPLLPVRTERRDDFKCSPELMAEMNKHGMDPAAFAKETDTFNARAIGSVPIVRVQNQIFAKSSSPAPNAKPFNGTSCSR
jgi:hypothetical protein